jgi:hypothetical protein
LGIKVYMYKHIHLSHVNSYAVLYTSSKSTGIAYVRNLKGVKGIAEFYNGKNNETNGIVRYY